MLQPRIPTSLISSPSTTSPLTQLTSLLNTLTLHPVHHTHPFSTTTHLPASHAAQGRANGPGDSAGRRLGSKRGASEYVVPGNIIFKQRGTKWFPGENVGMGRDHTIYATEPGWVRYYRDPETHPKRRYIGVALKQEGRGSVLPIKKGMARVRRLGMFATVRKEDSVKDVAEGEGFLEGHLTSGSIRTKAAESFKGRKDVMSQLELGQWTPMHELVREAEANQVQVRPFDRRDRFYAWRLRTKKFEAKKLVRAAAGKGKKPKKARARK